MPSTTRKDHHKILNISKHATIDEIRIAYKKLALKWHPDRHYDAKEKEEAEAKFIEINRAYRALTEKRERRRNREPHDEPERKASGTSSPPASPQDSSSSSAFHSNPGGSPVDTDTQTTPPSSPPASPESPFPLPSNTPYTADAQLPKPSAKPEPRSSSWSPMPAIKSFLPSSFRAGSNSERQRSATPRSSRKHTTRPPSSQFHTEFKQDASIHVQPDSTRPRKKSMKQGLHNFESKAKKKASSTRSRPKERPPSGRNSRAKPDRSPSPELRRSPSPRDTPKEWRYRLQLTLEELFHGTEFKFRINRYRHLNTRKKDVSINVNIPPGCSEGDEIRCVGAGNYCKDGSLQDIIFVIQELPHHAFTRVKDDLFVEVKIPWVDSLCEETGEIMVEGIDGEELWVAIPYRLDRELKGEQFIMGRGMPVRGDGRGRRGDLIVRWEIVLNAEPRFTSRWNTLRRMFHL